MKDFIGVIIEESLEDNDVLSKVKIVETKVEKVTKRHKTPHVKQWTMHTVEIEEYRAEEVAEDISRVLDSSNGEWYADFKNDYHHYIIFKNKVFKVDRSSKEQYDEVTRYGISLGIPDYQLDFSSDVKEKD